MKVPTTLNAIEAIGTLITAARIKKTIIRATKKVKMVIAKKSTIKPRREQHGRSLISPRFISGFERYFLYLFPYGALEIVLKDLFVVF